jgi:hypothetical protein
VLELQHHAMYRMNRYFYTKMLLLDNL